MKNADATSKRLLVACVILAGSVFVIDFFTPLGVATAVAYVAVVMLSLWCPGRRSTLLSATAGTALAVIEHLLTAKGGPDWQAITNDLIAIAAIWTTAFVVLRQKAAQKELRKSEEWFRNSFDYAATGMVIETPEGRFLRVNPALCRFLGYSAQELAGKHYTEITHPEDAEIGGEKTRRLLAGELPFFELEKRYVRQDGGVVWGQVIVSAMRDAGGQPLHMIAQITDITERKKAGEALRRSEEELRSLAARLISVQEEESSRVSRELHDDLNQRLAVLTLGIAKLERQLAPLSEPVCERLQVLQELVGNLSDDIRRIAYRLHPASLDHLGLVVALEAECVEFSRLEGIPVDFTHRAMPRSLPENISLCLYRIARESLRNIARHAEAAQAAVRLERATGGVRLVVADCGKGFDPASLKSGEGLGLISMTERVRLVDGTLSVKSAPAQGTQVEVWVPLPVEVDDE
jgi:PAS domain S-box-containing protein